MYVKTYTASKFNAFTAKSIKLFLTNRAFTYAYPVRQDLSYHTSQKNLSQIFLPKSNFLFRKF